MIYILVYNDHLQELFYTKIIILIYIEGTITISCNHSYFYNLDSSGSVQSWASSLSADSQSEEAAADFMKSFVPLLFDAPNTIDQEQKANFGQMVLVCVKIGHYIL